MQLIRADKGELKDIYAQMQKNFIPDEVRTYSDLERLHGNGKYAVYHIEDSGKKIGFMCVWTLDGFAFLEHFVVYEAYRNDGNGGKALDLLKEKFGAVILEAEPPQDPLQARRVRFYERHGLCLNPQEYWQPPYSEDGNACNLKIMSYPRPLSDFKGTVKKIYKEVYGREYE